MTDILVRHRHRHRHRHRQWRVGIVLVVLGALWLLSAAFPYSWPGGILVQGAFSGTAAGLLALGLVITYRTNRAINFAYGAMGSAAAELGIVCYQKDHLPWAACVLVSLAAGGAIGAAVDQVMRRFTNASRLVVTVASIGLMQVLIGLQFGVAFWSRQNPLVTPFSTGLSSMHFDIGRTVFTGNDLAAVALAPIAVTALGWLLMRTRTGTAVRALGDDPDRAKLLGIPIRRLSLLVWLLVGVLAAAVMILNAPTNGLPSTPFVSAGGVFMPALAAAVIAKMESLPTAFGSGVALGIFDAVVSYNIHQESLTTVALLLAILLALLARRWQGTRAEAQESSWSLVNAQRPLPAAVAEMVEVRVARWGILVVLGAAAVLFPIVAPPARVHTVAGYVVLGIAVLSLVVLTGWSGTISLGQLAIVGVGAVTAGDLVAKLNVDFFLAMVGAAVVSAAVSVVIGLPALRVRPVFLAVTTLAFAAAVDQYLLNPANHPSWIPAQVIRPVLWKRFPLTSERGMYYLCAALLVATIVVVRMMQRSRPRRVLQAARDNPNAAAAVAIPVIRTRLAGMIISGVIAGVAGALWAMLQYGVGASSFPAQDSVTLFSMGVVGGIGSIYGSLTGVAATELLIFLISSVSSQGSQFASLGTGVLLLVILMVFPGGLGQALEQARDRVVERLAARRGIQLTVGAAAGSLATSPPTRASAAGRSPSASPPTATRIFQCQNLVASYGPLQVLFGVDLEIGEGEIVALLGTNGAGKSTILKAVMGLLSSEGPVLFAGRSISGMPADAIARLGVAMMPGGRGVFPSLTVGDNLRLACWQLRREGTAASMATEEALTMFPVLRQRTRQLAGNLSGGEQQQLSLAMAFVTKPKLLLIDELSLGLAPGIVSQLCEKVRDIHRGGTTVVVVEQSLNVALQLADRAVFLEKGAVRFEGATKELANRPDLLRSVFIGHGSSARRGRKQREAQTSRQRAGNTDLVCRGITKRFGGVTALDRVDLEIRSGRTVGLIGHNGSGKTTLFDVISGFQTPSTGRVLLGGVDVTAAPAHRRAVAGLGRSFQEARLFPSLTVTQTVMAALDQHLASHDWFAASLGAPPSVDSEVSGRARADEVIELLGLGGYAQTPIADLSTGTRRVVELACVLAQDPAVILLDEPSAGVAQKDTEALGPLLRDVQSKTGSTVVVIEHDMTLLSSLCDEFVALEQGTIICSGPPATVLAHPRVIQSYLGTDHADIPSAGREPKRVPRSSNGKKPATKPRRRASGSAADRAEDGNGTSPVVDVAQPAET